MPTAPTRLGSVLIVDDDADVLTAARLLLKRHARAVRTETDPARLPALLAEARYDLVLLDMNFTRDAGSGREGFEWLGRILEIDPRAVVVLITAFGDVDMAVRAIRQGATDFVIKPWRNDALLAKLSAATRLREARAEAAPSASATSVSEEFVGDSPAMRAVFATLGKVAATDASVLVLGENGTGKELAARALHRASPRKDGPFVSVDLGAIPDTLFESELFGHVKGAFTDARADREGRFEAASGGTLFLDEIGNLSLALQAKLLRALQSRAVTRVGAHEPVPFDARLVCATNTPLYEAVQTGAFRQDLLYRINTVEVTLPPLRARDGDVRVLAEHFLARYAGRYGRAHPSFSPAALAALERHAWPGNVRELQHAVERAVILSDTARIEPADLLLTAAATPMESDALALDDYNLEAVERMVIRKAMEKHEGNVSRAAEELGLTRASLYRRLEKYGL